MLMGIAMGVTIVGSVLSPWGKQSGAHFNPAVTFTFYRLGKVEKWDAVFYAAAGSGWKQSRSLVNTANLNSPELS
jgi:glycerol uptake facilitator-like aquaporin